MNYVEELRQLVGHRPLILVGSVVILLNNNNEILLQKRKTSSYGMWGLPGGLMELGESAEDTARREIYEETGLNIGKLNLFDVFSGAKHLVIVPNGDKFYSVTIAYYTQDFKGQIRIDEVESLELRFISLDSLPDNTVKSHKNIIDRFVEICNS